MPETDASRDTIEGAFAHPAYAPARRSGAAAVLLGGAPLRVLWANVAATRAFEAKDIAELTGRLLGSDRSTAHRLGHLAARLIPGEPPRLERLRFAWDFAPRSLTFLCSAVPHQEGILALAGVESGEDGDLWLTDAPGASPGAALVDGGAAARQDEVLLDADPADEADQLVQARCMLRDRAGGTEQVRFVWKTDAAGTTIDADEALLGRFGLTWPTGGAGLAASAAAFDPDAAESLAQALDRQITWTGIELDVPASLPSGATLTVPVSLSGSPTFEPPGRFRGYRGFGRIDVTRATLLPESRPARIPESGPEPAAGPIDTAPDIAADPDAPLAAAESMPQRSATVVQLRPLVRGTSPLDVAKPASEIDPEVALSENERINFQEIGRTLTAAVGALLPLEDAPPVPLRTAHVVAPTHDGTAVSEAALLVENTAAALMVTRHPRVLFSNAALLGELQYDDHSTLADALGLHFAAHPVPSGGGPVVLELPQAFGAPRRFEAVPKAIAWHGEPATLWTLRADDPERPRLAGADAAPDAELAAMLDIIDRAVATTDLHGRILTSNRAAAAWFGASAGSEPTLAAIMAPESQAGFQARLQALRSEERAASQTSADHVARMVDGSMVPIGMTLTRLGPERIGAVWRDLSAERETEWELSRLRSQSERASEQQPGFLAKVSHDIRTPLNAILGFAEIMIDERFGPLGNVRYKDYLRDIHASGEQVVKLIGDLLDLSRIEAGKVDLDPGPVDLNRIVTGCVAETQTAAHRERVIIRTSLAARLPMALVDERSARQMIGNVLTNAVRFNEPGGQVIVSTAVNEAGGAVVVRLRDTGAGMSDAEVATALEPFRRLAPSNSQGGTGLGLPLTRALALANGASLSIRSKPGQGTLVEISFPSSAAPAARVPA